MKPKTKLYKVILQLNDKEYETEGDTLLEAIEALEVDRINTGALLIVQKGKSTFERRFNSITQVKRLLNNKVFKIIVSKNIDLML